jgi:hypothetical protein
MSPRSDNYAAAVARDVRRLLAPRGSWRAPAPRPAPRRAGRTDRGSLLARPVETSYGTIFEGRAARSGRHEYPNGPEYRDLAELQRIVKQLPGAPLTLRHPVGMIADGAEAEIIGRVLRASIERVAGEDHAAVQVLVTGGAGLDAIRRGTVELSLGYEVDMVGNHQSNTKVDHLAVVEVARCGTTCSLRTDASKETPMNEHLRLDAAAAKFGEAPVDSTLDPADRESMIATLRADGAELSRPDSDAYVASYWETWRRYRRVEQRADCACTAIAGAVARRNELRLDDLPHADRARVAFEAEQALAHRRDSLSDREYERELEREVQNVLLLPARRGVGR